MGVFVVPFLYLIFKEKTMKHQTVQTHKIENEQIIPINTSKLVLEASERFAVFQEKFLDSGLQIQISFEEKNSDLILALINTNRPITEINYLPKPVVICTATLVEGNTKILSATADAPTFFTAPYKAAETMALTRLFDRLGIDSIVHEHEIGTVTHLENNWKNDSNDSTHLTGIDEFPIDLKNIPSREDISKSNVATSQTTQVVETKATAEDNTQVNASEPVVETEATAEDDTPVNASEPVVETEAAAEDDTQVNASEPVVETEATGDAYKDFTLVCGTLEDMAKEPAFPVDLPKPFQVKLMAKLQLIYGDEWVCNIPSTKQEAYSVLGIR